MWGGTSAAMVAVIALSLGLAGCDGEKATTTRPTETAEALPKLPPRWRLYDDRRQGFALGLPPGWHAGRACAQGGKGKADGDAAAKATLLCAPERVVSVSIVADRTGEAVRIPPRQFALRAIESLGDAQFRGELRYGQARPFPSTYQGVAVRATGRAAGTGIEQRIELVVLRRVDVANFTAVVAAKATAPAHELRLAEHILRTLRSHPVGTPVESAG